MNFRPTQSTAPWGLVAVAGLAGLAIGYFAARFEYGGKTDRAVVEHVRAPSAAPGDSSTSRSVVGPVVRTRIERADSPNPLAVRGLLIQRDEHPAHEVLLPLPALFRAVSGQLETGADPVTTNTVDGVHTGAGLALLATGLKNQATLRPPDSGALYLGLELEMVSTGARRSARVDTVARERADGQVVHGVRVQSSPPSGLSALVLPGTRELAGILTGRRMEDGTWEAIDAYAIRRIGLPLSGEPSVPVDRFGREFFDNTPAGRRLRFYAAAGEDDWQRVIENGDAVLESTPDDPDIRQILEHAYSRRAQSLLEQNKTGAALELLDDAVSLLPDSAGLLETRAAALHAGGYPGDAAEALLGLLDSSSPSPNARRKFRGRLLTLIDDPHLTPERRQDLLRQAIERDTGYAPYHARIGELLYDQRRYAEALSRWNYAAQLDPTLHETLQQQMAAARRRLDGSSGTVVPLISNGHSYFVEATVNNLRRRLLLDTGASFSAISPELASSLGIDYTAATRQVRLSTANGVIDARLVTLQRIELNGAEVRNIDAVVLEQLNHGGILGLNFLNHFNIDIDRTERKMTLRR